MKKRLIKKFIPKFVLLRLRKYRGIKYSKKLSNMNTQDIFTEIYNNNYWQSNESASGPGSSLSQTESLIKDFENLLNEMKIKSVLDIPCGDFKWMQKVNISKIDYIGADIVEELIKKNIEKYKSKNINFRVLNLITDPLPKSDLIIVRDCLVHFSNADIYNAMRNIKLSGCKYILTTTFTNYNLNHDIVTGDWRRINLQENPFNFPKPILIINENCTEGDGEYKDKSMALWKISETQ